MRRDILILILGCVLALASCHDKSTGVPDPKSAGHQTPRIFATKGTVKRLDLASRSITIQHEEIPNFMPAMTMPFKVKDPNELQGVQPGDLVTFRLNVTDEESWIDQLKKMGDATTNGPSAPPSIEVGRELEPLQVGGLMPDYHFTNELGQAVSLGGFRGKALALTFIFTRCPLPEFCPLMSRNFAAAHQQLAAAPGAPNNWHLLSISFDPNFDTPAVLKSYAQLYKYDPTHWSFVTGATADLQAMTQRFELPVIPQGASWEHKLRTVVIDASGRIQKIFLGNQWTAEELVSEILTAAQARTPGDPPPKIER